MFSIFKEKRKVSEIFSSARSWSYSSHIEVKDFVIKINTNSAYLNHYINNTLGNFMVEKKVDYSFNFHKHVRNIKLDECENDNYQYDFIRFFDTFFHYRYNKKLAIIDVLLPKKYENWEVENFFKIFISSVSLKHNALLIHASAIVINEEIILFSGQSGAGKSTIAELSDYEVIHDDNILISYLGNEVFELESIPFKIPYERKKIKGKIRGFYRIFQNQKSFVKEINSNMKLTHLLFGLWAFDHFGNNDSKEYNNEVLNYCTVMLPHLNVKELYFTKNQDFLKLI